MRESLKSTTTQLKLNGKPRNGPRCSLGGFQTIDRPKDTQSQQQILVSVLATKARNFGVAKIFDDLAPMLG